MNCKKLYDQVINDVITTTNHVKAAVLKCYAENILKYLRREYITIFVLNFISYKSP